MSDSCPQVSWRRVSWRQSTRWTSPVAALLICAVAGCTPLATVYWVLKDGNTAPPEYSGLKNRRVAVVWRGGRGHEFRQLEASVPQQIGKKVSHAIKRRLGRKVHMISPEKIEQYADENEWQDFIEVGRDLKAERVLAIDVEKLSIKNSGTLHHASTTITVTVYDMQQDGEQVFEKIFEINFPPKIGGVSVSEMSERQFIGLLVNYVARNIGELFYDHNPRETFADHGV